MFNTEELGLICKVLQDTIEHQSDLAECYDVDEGYVEQLHELLEKTKDIIQGN
jgi:hypothetical protein